MPVRLDKPWAHLTPEQVDQLGAQLGVFELADATGQVVFIGKADARTLFGLRSEVTQWLGKAATFRVEVTTAYHTRWRELMMAYHADHGCYPPENSDTDSFGRLSPAGAAS